ncbi:hypothetical protein [Acetivibrio mesophilus]|uniref:Uncharacterized protein n=1 Tax=Acetivibrio mesophilus TaxID=2487273 RepID=A0A4Q0I6J0_9FIRM|nr:hypothetical protein [Acetivibrio mesophilus]ODM27496.1 hypothetical protein A7W90_15445 [Clostridium sp. Bc-iso-3]RXE59455.1 hypothetical protein EFD62_07335 [Acetivibrio mesophilus]HHV30246.1 hypothetical protein [Clostridium sp.]
MKKMIFGTNSRKIILTVVLSVAIIHIVQVVQASVAAEPGSDKDPLVSQSYVDSKFAALESKIKELKSGEDSKLEEMAKKLEEAEKRLEEIEKYGKFEALELNKDQVLIAGASAELILRGGKALAIGGEGGGLSDITSGTGVDVNTDDEVPLNHLLLISRDDGRGLKVMSEKAWVLVKGPYTIK